MDPDYFLLGDAVGLARNNLLFENAEALNK